MDTKQSAPETAEDERSIRELVSQAGQAQYDADSLPSLHTRDTVIVNIAGRRVLGRTAFAEAMAEALASPLGEVETRVEIEDIRFASADTAIVSCLKKVYDRRAAPAGSLPSAGALTYVVAKAGGSWRIALAQTTPIAAGGGEQ